MVETPRSAGFFLSEINKFTRRKPDPISEVKVESLGLRGYPSNQGAIPHPTPKRLECARASPIPPVLVDVIMNEHPKEEVMQT